MKLSVNVDWMLKYIFEVEVDIIGIQDAIPYIHTIRNQKRGIQGNMKVCY